MPVRTQWVCTAWALAAICARRVSGELFEGAGVGECGRDGRHYARCRAGGTREVKNEFVQANPNFSAEEMTVSCGNNYLTAVSLCLTKDLKPTACQNLRDCRANAIRVTPVR